MTSDANNLPQGAERLSKELTLRSNWDCAFLDTNAAWLQVLGWDTSELRGKKYFDLVHSEDFEKTCQELGRMTAGGTRLGFCNRVRHKDGSCCWISWTAIAGEEIVYATGWDISAQEATDGIPHIFLWLGNVVPREFALGHCQAASVRVLIA